MSIFIINLNLKLKHYPSYLALLLRSYIHFYEWGMLEVFMIGALVTIIKMHPLAHIGYEAGFFCFIALVVVTVCSSFVVDKDELWRCIENGQRPQ